MVSRKGAEPQRRQVGPVRTERYVQMDRQSVKPTLMWLARTHSLHLPSRLCARSSSSHDEACTGFLAMRPKVSLTLIVRDAEMTFRVCLKSLRGVSDEIRYVPLFLAGAQAGRRPGWARNCDRFKIAARTMAIGRGSDVTRGGRLRKDATINRTCRRHGHSALPATMPGHSMSPSA